VKVPNFQPIISPGVNRPACLLGANIYYFQQVDSTNDIALTLAQQGAPEGTTVVAECQTNGRGQRGHNWFSPKQAGIYISVILRPKSALIGMNHLKLLMAVAVAQCVNNVSGLPVGIKWPNDVTVNGRKVAGILVETEWNGDSPQYFVIGMGLNVNLTAEMLSEARLPQATSLLIELGRECIWEIVLQQLLVEIEKNYLIYQSQGFEPIWQQLKEMEIISGSWIEVVSLGHRFEGEALGISADGELLIRSGDVVRRICSGRINILSHNYHKLSPAQTRKTNTPTRLS